MTIFNTRKLCFIFASLFLIYSQITYAFSIKEFFGFEDEEEVQQEPKPQKTPPKQANKTEKTSVPAFKYKLDFDELQNIIAVLNPEQKKALLANPEAFKNFINNEARKKSLLSAAHANKIDENERNLFIAQRGAENVIREIYLNQLIASKIPAGYPSEEQMQEYYDNNKDNFAIEERVHVWQIFLPLEENADKKAIELQKKEAEKIISDITKGKTDFATAAQKHSSLPAGKNRGGFLGLVRVSQLLPEIREPLMKLLPDKLSSPVVTDNGIHILKRGNIIEKQQLAFNTVKNQIRKNMTDQLRNQIRQAVFNQAVQVYPSDITDNKMEEWRLKLRTSTNGESTAATE